MVGDSSSRSSLEVPSPNNLPTSTRRGSEDGESQRQILDSERGRTIIPEQWRSNDPRSSSTQSLRPVESSRDGRRTLLLIYIHGFMGNEMSFQSFPAHVHNLLSIFVADTHVVHTKLYPRYKSRKAIEFARDDFSEWLEPNGASTTDVILLGHSMGGILSAEVALLLPRSPVTGHAFRHRILGTIGFDTPFLGLHPGVIISGIGSLFRPALNQDPPAFNQDAQIEVIAQSSQISRSSSHEASPSALSPLSTSLHPTESMSSLSLSQSSSSMPAVISNDTNYNPPFPNDKHLVERKGWRSIMHFITKHSDGLTNATKEYFISHLEFGGCLADYPGLKIRYAKIRALEDVDELAERRPSVSRVRFVNYWTASTGYPKKKAPGPSPMIDNHDHLKPMQAEMKEKSVSRSSSRSATPTPRISIEEYNDEGVPKHGSKECPDSTSLAFETQTEELGDNSSIGETEAVLLPDSQPVDSTPMDTNEEPLDKLVKDLPNMEPEPPLPPIPPIPEEPQMTDLNIYKNKDSRKIAEKEQKRAVKAYQQALKDRENAINDRQKLYEKQERQARQAHRKLSKASQKQSVKDEKAEQALQAHGKLAKASQKQSEKTEQERQATVNPKPQDIRESTGKKAKRDKKFCMMPPEVNGRDKCWIRVHMQDMDEVSAHCRLFFPGPQYESLVGDVATRIEQWVKEDMSRRVLVVRGGL